MVEINKEFWQNRIKQFNQNIELNIESNDAYILANDYINELVKQQAKDMDNRYCEFLEANGYKIDKPYNIQQLKEIQKDLESKDKFLDCLEYTEFAENCTQAYHYVIPFFNCISNPLSEETRNEIIEKWKKKNRKDK